MSFKPVKIIHTLDLTPHKKVYFRRIVQHGRLDLDIRVWKRPVHSRIFYPSRTGFCMPQVKIQELEQVLTKFKLSAALYGGEIDDK